MVGEWWGEWLIDELVASGPSVFEVSVSVSRYLQQGHNAKYNSKCSTNTSAPMHKNPSHHREKNMVVHDIYTAKLSLIYPIIYSANQLPTYEKRTNKWKSTLRPWLSEIRRTPSGTMRHRTPKEAYLSLEKRGF
jgi:hypothetical protein